MTMYPIVILCGGLATRLKPVNETIPKSLIEVAGRPFINWQLAILDSWGFSDIILCTGYLGNKIQKYLENDSYGLNIKFSNDGKHPLGTGGAVKNAFHLLPNKFFVMYGDSYLDFNYKNAQYIYNIKEKLALMTIYKNDNQFDLSNVQYDWFEGGIIKLDLDNLQDMCYIDYGVGIFDKECFDGFEGNFSLMDVYKEMLRKNQLASYVAQNRFYQIGTFEGITELENYLKERKYDS
jgi:N-acetyl-alpha-D-muramate 1-phosphate uridylyltransferase